MLSLQIRRINDALIGVDIRDDPIHNRTLISKVRQGSGHRLIDDDHVASTHQLLELDKTQIWFDTRCIAVHHQTDCSSRCQNRGLSISHAVLFAVADCRLP